jgi:hypothetical protein
MFSRRIGKFNSRGALYKGRLYHSQKERNYAILLDGLIQAGEVKEVERQVTFRLCGPDGKLVCKYIADFVVTLEGGKRQVHEVKGYPSKEWPIKKKLFESNYPDLELIVV